MRRTRPNCKYFLVSLSTICLLGCASTKNPIVKTSPEETEQDAVSALGAIASSYTNKEMDEAQLKQVAKDIQSDEQAQSAIKVITDSMEGKTTGIKYSPVTGKRYSADLEFDPETGAKLVPLEP